MTKVMEGLLEKIQTAQKQREEAAEAVHAARVALDTAIQNHRVATDIWNALVDEMRRLKK